MYTLYVQACTAHILVCSLLRCCCAALEALWSIIEHTVLQRAAWGIGALSHSIGPEHRADVRRGSSCPPRTSSTTIWVVVLESSSRGREHGPRARPGDPLEGHHAALHALQHIGWRALTLYTAPAWGYRCVMKDAGRRASRWTAEIRTEYVQGGSALDHVDQLNIRRALSLAAEVVHHAELYFTPLLVFGSALFSETSTLDRSALRLHFWVFRIVLVASYPEQGEGVIGRYGGCGMVF